MWLITKKNVGMSTPNFPVIDGAVFPFLNLSPPESTTFYKRVQVIVDKSFDKKYEFRVSIKIIVQFL